MFNQAKSSLMSPICFYLKILKQHLEKFAILFTYVKKETNKSKLNSCFQIY